MTKISCRNAGIVPRVRRYLWTRAVRIFSLLSLLISWRLRIFRMNLLRLSCYQGRTNQNRQALYQHQPLLLFLVGLDCQRWCYLRFCNLQNAQKGRPSHPPNPGAPRRALSQTRSQRELSDSLIPHLRGVPRLPFTARIGRARFYNVPSELARYFFRDGG